MTTISGTTTPHTAHGGTVELAPSAETHRPLGESEVIVIDLGGADPLLRLAHGLGVEASVPYGTLTGAVDHLTEEMAARLLPESGPTVFAITVPDPFGAPQREISRLLQEAQANRRLNDANDMKRRRQLEDHMRAIGSARPDLDEHLLRTYAHLLQLAEVRLGPGVTAYIMDKPLAPGEMGYKGRVWTLIGSTAATAVLKHPPAGESPFGGMRAERTVAFRRLYEMEERSPYISYQVRETDGNNTIEDHVEWFETARSMAREGRLFDAIELVRDATLGADFLVQNGFRLTDLKGDNIRLNLRTGKGVLFDFDGLVTESYVLPWGGYLAATNRIPPERQENGAKYDGGAIDETEMSYELGFTIRQIMAIVSEVATHGVRAGIASTTLDITLLESLSSQMTSADPNERPTLAAAAEQLNQWLQTAPATKETGVASAGALVRQIMRRFRP